jgi:rhomboid family GlyGly-CTERM serine protease
MIPTSPNRAGWRDLCVAHALPLALATACLVVAALGDRASASLRYQREALGELELWRALTCHLVHLGPAHLALNLAGLAAVWALGSRELRGAPGASAALGAALGASVGLYGLVPSLAWYVGLSGVLHGLVAAIALRAGGAFGVALGLGLASKLAWEARYGAALGTAELIGAPVVTAAHLYGAVGATLAMLGSAGWSRAAAIIRASGRSPSGGL